MKARYWRIRPEYYRRFSEYWMDYPTDIGVKEIYLHDINGTDIKNSSSISYISAYTQGSSASYKLSTMVNNDISSYALFVGFYDNISPYTAIDLRKMYGVYNCIKFDFGYLADIRNIQINFDRSGPVIIECSNDNNIWYRVGYETSIGSRSVIKNYPISESVPAYTTNHYFWGIKCLNHTPNATTNIKIKEFRMLDDVGNPKAGSTTRLNTFSFFKDELGTFNSNGAANVVANAGNATPIEIYGTAKQIGSTTDSYAGISYSGSYYNEIPWHNPVFYWNNTNGRTDLGLALAPICPDTFVVKFDNTVPNLPKCVSIVSCSTLYCPQDSPTGYDNQPFDFLSLITIDDFTPYLSTGLTISGLSNGKLKINGTNFTPDDIKPITTCSLASGYFTTEQIVTLEVNEEATIYYRVNNGSIQTYLGPITLDNDAEFTFWSVDTSGNIEASQTRNYVIDLHPLVVSITPRPGTYREVPIKFKFSKPGQLMWSYREFGSDNDYYAATWTEWTDFEELVEKQFLLTKSIDIIYQCTSEGRTYPPQAVSFYYDPNAHSVTIQPSVIEATASDKILVSLENNYE